MILTEWECPRSPQLGEPRPCSWCLYVFTRVCEACVRRDAVTVAFWALGGLAFGFPSSTNVLHLEKCFLKVTLFQRQHSAWLRGPIRTRKSTRGPSWDSSPGGPWERRRRQRGEAGRGGGRGLTAAARRRLVPGPVPLAHGGEGFQGRGTLDKRSEDITSLVSTTTPPCARRQLPGHPAHPRCLVSVLACPTPRGSVPCG